MRLYPTRREGPDHPGRRLIAVIGAVLVLLVFAAQPSPLSAGDEAQAEHSPRLDSRLAQVLEAYERAGNGEAISVATGFGIAVDGGRLRLIIEAAPGRPEAATAAARGLGAVVEGAHANLTQALVPLAALDALSRNGAVGFVRPPLKAVPFATSQGVGLTNADDWHLQGLTGSGVKVGILDLGFAGYTGLLGKELPATVTTKSYHPPYDEQGEGDITGGGQQHGAGVAEIVHDMAPGGQMYFTNFSTEVELGLASQWLTTQGVQVINASWGYFTSGPGDGSGPVDDVVTQSTAAGALWSVAAGNHVNRHWSGQFRDANSNSWHEFTTSSSPDEGNQPGLLFGGFFFPSIGAGQTIEAEIKWDDPFGASCRDYDLYLKRTDNSGNLVTVAASETRQYDGVCVPGANPVEILSAVTPVADEYHISIQEHHSTTDAFIELYLGHHDFEYRVNAGSVLQPADNANAITAGAVHWQTPNTIESFSSRGPTRDGRIKPDIVGPDGVDTITYGAGVFGGTSAAAPHITGAAALVKQRLPCYTPAQLKAFLEAMAVDLGPAGKDNSFGSGRLSLTAVPLDTDADGIGDACDIDDDNDAWSDVAEAAIGTDPLLKCGANANPADINSDLSFDISDIGAIAGSFGRAVPAVPARNDISPDPPDAFVDIGDIGAVAGLFGRTCQ